MAVAQLGTDVNVGAGAVLHGITGTFTNYYVQSISDGDKNVDFVDVDDADGVLTTRVILKRHEKAVLTLIPKLNTNPLTDFPVGDACAITGLTAFYVESMTVDKTKSPHVVTATLVKLGITLS